ncbi:hypothetical protein EDF62_3341 [Leucobacter luti]|uniref:Uncharacterized protein n=1 Tax=Leucobacter luti TaxID=340320 RepID=A0A4V3CXB3_9MICO|nr:hypothetical protein [Leucobacter luti]TDP89588.1 hypothetical protein EDF62_3341 [Leucobacter luti]
MSNITRRQDQGLGKTAAGGSGGSFASHDRAPTDGPALSEPEKSTIPNQEVINFLGDGCDDNEFSDEELWDVASNWAQSNTSSDLIFIDYDDQLFDEQIDTYLAGDVDGELDDELQELFFEHRRTAAEEQVNEMLEEWGADPIDVDDTVKDRLREIVEEHDTSDPQEGLAKNTHSQLMRAPLSQGALLDHATEWERENERGYTSAQLYDGNADKAIEAREDYLLRHLGEIGVDTSQFTAEDRAQVRSLATEGPHYWHEGVRLDAIWYGDIRDARASSDPEQGRTIRIGGAPLGSRENQTGKSSIVLLDTVNGSGYDAQLSVPLTVTLDSDRPAHLDSGGSAGRYGWDDTAGVHKPYYDVDVNDMTDAQYDEQKYERNSDGRLSPQAQQQALSDLGAQLSAKQRELRAYGDRHARFDRDSVSEAELDKLDAHYNQLHDDISALQHERRQVHINAGFVREYSPEWLVANNID